MKTQRHPSGFKYSMIPNGFNLTSNVIKSKSNQPHHRKKKTFVKTIILYLMDSSTSKQSVPTPDRFFTSFSDKRLSWAWANKCRLQFIKRAVWSLILYVIRQRGFKFYSLRHLRKKTQKSYHTTINVHNQNAGCHMYERYTIFYYTNWTASYCSMI